MDRLLDRLHRPARTVLVVSVASLSSCGFEPTAGSLSYALSAKTIEATADDPAARASIEREIAALFGTPDAPRYGDVPAFAALAEVDRASDAEHLSLARAAERYRAECLHCHGVEGGGDGPSAYGLRPKPRDFRNGIFKYTALKDQSRPRRVDLLHTLEQGVAGTSMPNFQRLPPATREGLADYVRFLSIRGEVESVLVASWKDEGAIDADVVREATTLVWERWQRADSKLVVFDGPVPPSTPERIARGDALFHDALKGNCQSCHGASGAGDGPAAWKIGVDGRKEPAYVDAWGEPLTPRDLREGVFRGGARGIDMYRRIYAGIPGGPMPALGEAKTKDGAPLVTTDEIWCLVHYVRSLSQRGEAP